MVTSFLPKGYAVPSSGNGGAGRYLKFEKDKTVRFRVVSEALTTGWEYWNQAGKPVRLRGEPAMLPMDIRLDETGKPEKVKHFWAMAVLDTSDNQIKILQVNQVTIQKELEKLFSDPDWGHPNGYDIKIVKTGEKLTTKYAVTAVPHKALTDAQKQTVKDNPVNLDALFTGGDPFTAPPANDSRYQEIGYASEAHYRELREKYEKNAKLAIAAGLTFEPAADLSDLPLPDMQAAITRVLEAMASDDNPF